MMSKEQIKQWIKEKNMKSVDDVQSALKDLFADTIQEMLEAEIESSLGYAKHDMKNKRTTNSRNGYSKKTVRSEYGDVDIQVPRDREGDFEPNIVNGIDLDGHKDVLGIWIGENESAKFWLHVLNELRNRGVQDILITSVDNLRGFTEAISACYPKTEIQKCVIHQIRNSIKYVSYKDLKKITSELKPIYKAPTEQAALEELEQFEQAWGSKYPLMVRSWRNNWDEIATFFKYPPEIRKLIYTTNVIESYHRQLRKVTKGKAMFPTDDALLKMLYLVTMDVLRKWTGRVQNWGQILLQLSVFFEDRVQPYIR
ncbi:IS256 family transposase [Brevibacillus brevis]|nr:IS256 family transposase [Brevibacillus brevis]WJQ80161.1 IS256 family transposase [Brevibacillus brevis]